jgi:hypothetical protein
MSDEQTIRTIEAAANKLRTIQMLVRMGKVAMVEWSVLDHVIGDLDALGEQMGGG